VRAVLEREQRVFRVEGVGSADVHDIHAAPKRIAQRIESRASDLPGQLLRPGPRAAAHGHDLSAEVAHGGGVDASHEARAHERRPELRHPAFRNIWVRTSMSSRACSGGVRHSTPFTTQSWKWASSRAKLSS
jgi:hypothetical protein